MPQPIQKRLFILDKFFVYGKKSRLDLRKEKLNKKIDIIEMGNIASQINSKNVKHSKYPNRFKKYKMKCAIFDASSTLNWYRNGRLISANWKYNLDFLNLIYDVMLKNKDILFIYKNKSLSFLKVKAFENYFKKLSKLKNVYIVRDFNKISGNHLIGYCNFSISRHSSINDDMLALNKPIFVYDGKYSNLISECIEYNKECLFVNGSDLSNKIKMIKKNYNLTNKKMKKIRKFFFSKTYSKKYKSEINKIKQQII